MNTQFFVNHKTRMCRTLGGHPNNPEHQKNVSEAISDGFVEVTGDQMDEFRAVTQAAKDAGWNPDRIGYAKFMARQAASATT